MSDSADRELDNCVHPLVGPGLRKSHAEDRAASKEARLNFVLLTPEQRANVEAKIRFAKRCLDVLGEDDENGERRAPAVRELALFFCVKRTKLHERMRFKRTDLAPLPEWFEKLENYCEWQRLNAEFLRTA